MATGEEQARRGRLVSRVGGAGQILALVREGKAQTIGELATAMDLARSTVVQRLDHLIAVNLLAHEPAEAAGPGSARGRPPALLRFNPDAGVVLVAQVGMSGWRVAATNLDGSTMVERFERFEIEQGPSAVTDHLSASLAAVLAAAGRPVADVRGVGVGLPSAVELSTIRSAGSGEDMSWEGFPLAARLRRRFAAPTLVDVDVNLLALGEQRFAWPGTGVLLCVKVGTVIGCGTVIGGKVVAGEHGAAGNIGHIAVTGSKVSCPCGNTGCLDMVASGRALVAQLRAAGLPVSDTAQVAALAREGVPEAVQAVRDAGRAIGEVLSHAVNLLNPGVIAFWGYLTEAEAELLAGIRESVYQRSLPATTQSLRLVRSTLGDSAGLAGAAMMVASEILSPDAVDEYLVAHAATG